MKPSVHLLGLGGAGCHIGHRLQSGLPQGWPVTLADTARGTARKQSVMPGAMPSLDPSAIRLFGEEVCHGNGSMGNPDLGRQAFLDGETLFRSLLAEVKILFIIAGMGGGTGSGALPPLVRMAQKLGCAVMALTTLPFSFEGKRRKTMAEKALSRFHERVDGLFVFPNDRVVTAGGDEGEAMGTSLTRIDNDMREVIFAVFKAGTGDLPMNDLEAILAGLSLLAHWDFSSGFRTAVKSHTERIT